MRLLLAAGLTFRRWHPESNFAVCAAADPTDLVSVAQVALHYVATIVESPPRRARPLLAPQVALNRGLDSDGRQPEGLRQSSMGQRPMNTNQPNDHPRAEGATQRRGPIGQPAAGQRLSCAFSALGHLSVNSPWALPKVKLFEPFGLERRMAVAASSRATCGSRTRSRTSWRWRWFLKKLAAAHSALQRTSPEPCAEQVWEQSVGVRLTSWVHANACRRCA